MQLQVARIGKPHGIRGEVTVQVLTDAPGDRFVPGTQFVVEPASAGPADRGERPLEQGHPAAGLRGGRDPQRRGDPPRRQALHRDRGTGRGRRRGLVRARARRASTSAWATRWSARFPACTPCRSRTCWWSTAAGRQGNPRSRSWSRSCPRSTSATGYVLVTPPAGLFEVNTEADDAGDARRRRSRARRTTPRCASTSSASSRSTWPRWSSR